MNSPATQYVLNWLQTDHYAFHQIKSQLERKQTSEQIAQFMHAVINGMIEDFQWQGPDPEEADWDQIVEEIPGIFVKCAQQFVHSTTWTEKFRRELADMLGEESNPHLRS